jgi:hypothetical protein
MDRAGVEQVVKSVLTEYGLPLTLVGLALNGSIWSVALREGGAAAVQLKLHDGPGHAIRRALMRALDLED